MRNVRLFFLLSLTVAVLASVLGVAGASGHVGGIDSRQGSPGALSSYPNDYNDQYRGWPVAPVHQQHPIRASFLDPRAGSVYHLGIDISVPDDQPEPGAPPQHTHRVYAVEGGIVSYPVLSKGASCGGHSVRVGHFGYGHTDPTGVVSNGEQVKAGQMIGWTCRGHWHVHLSEYQLIDGVQVAIDPLHPGGKLWPYVDTAKPVIKQLGFWTAAPMMWVHQYGAGTAAASGTPVDPQKLSGVVDVRAEIDDPQSFKGWTSGPTYGRLYSDLAPYSVSVSIHTLGGATVYSQELFRSDAYLSENLPSLAAPVLIDQHYAAGTVQALPAASCMKLKPKSCQGTFWYHLFGLPNNPASPYWDTRTVSDGNYLLTVKAADEAGNQATRTIALTVANGATASTTAGG